MRRKRKQSPTLETNLLATWTKLRVSSILLSRSKILLRTRYKIQMNSNKHSYKSFRGRTWDLQRWRRGLHSWRKFWIRHVHRRKRGIRIYLLISPILARIHCQRLGQLKMQLRRPNLKRLPQNQLHIPIYSHSKTHSDLLWTKPPSQITWYHLQNLACQQLRKSYSNTKSNKIHNWLPRGIADIYHQRCFRSCFLNVLPVW